MSWSTFHAHAGRAERANRCRRPIARTARPHVADEDYVPNVCRGMSVRAYRNADARRGIKRKGELLSHESADGERITSSNWTLDPRRAAGSDPVLRTTWRALTSPGRDAIQCHFGANLQPAPALGSG